MPRAVTRTPPPMHTVTAPDIRDCIARRDFGALRESFAGTPPADVADALGELPGDERAVAFRVLPQHQATDVFEYLEPDDQESLLKAMGTAEAARILSDISADDRTAFLEELPGAAVAQLLQLLTPEERHEAQTLLNYPENSVGRRMSPDFISIRTDWTIARVLDHVRRHGRDSETLNVLYVTDDAGQLIDDVRIREFLIRPLETVVEEFRDAKFVSLRATDEARTAIELFKKYDRNTLPVIDSGGKLLGIVTVDDFLDIYEEDTTGSIQKLGGMEALDEPYSTISMGQLVRKRGGWLAVLFVGELLTASAMAHFQSEIERAAVVALFLPLIISSGGNSGSQASTLIIRALAVGEIKVRDWWWVLRRELTCGAILGSMLGALGVFRIHLWQWLHLANYNTNRDYAPAGEQSMYDIPGLYHSIAATVGISLVGVVLWGTLCGAMLPFLLRRLKLDPAAISAPFVATLVDVTGLIIYFSVAFVVLKGTLL